MCKKQRKLPNLGTIIRLSEQIHPGAGRGQGSFIFRCGVKDQPGARTWWLLLQCPECFSTWLVDARNEKLIQGSQMQLT